MNNFKLWCASFCILLVITSVMRFLVPECKMKKVSDSVLSMIILLVMLVPFTDGIKKTEYDFDFDLQDYSESAQAKSQYEAALEKYIRDTLEADGIALEEITVSAQLDKDGYIAVNSIEITVADREQETGVLEIIKNKCGLDTEKVRIN